MATLMFVLMMQFVVSTRAGLVNYVQGDVSVKAMQSVEASQPEPRNGWTRTPSNALAGFSTPREPGSCIRPSWSRSRD